MNREPQQNAPEMSSVTENHIRLQRGSVRVLRAGTGPALVYLHGVGDAGEFLPPLERLAAKHAVIRPDHPGFLKSDDCAVGSIAEIAAVHRELLEKLGLLGGSEKEAVEGATTPTDVAKGQDPGFILMGCSLGGWIAVELALLIPEHIAALCLIGPAGIPGPFGEHAPNIFTMTSEETLRATIADPTTREVATAQPPREETRLRLARNREEARRLASDPYMYDPTLGQRAAGLNIPTHIVWGEQDGIIPAFFANSWTRMWPHARLTIIPGAGHLPHVERTEAFLDALAQAATLSGSVPETSVTEGAGAWN